MTLAKDPLNIAAYEKAGGFGKGVRDIANELEDHDATHFSDLCDGKAFLVL